MASLQSAAAANPSPSEGKGYDPEIKDIADYVHNKTIDSELAVSAAAVQSNPWIVPCCPAHNPARAGCRA